MAKSRPRGAAPTLRRWVGELALEDGDELVLGHAGMAATVLARWPATAIEGELEPWSETVVELSQADADERGGTCSYHLEHIRRGVVQATYRVRRIAASGPRDGSGSPASIDGVIGMLMKHLEARERSSQQMLSAMVAMSESTTRTLIQRLEALEGERLETLQSQREAMEATIGAAADIESRERLENKLYQLGDLAVARLAAPKEPASK